MTEYGYFIIFKHFCLSFCHSSLKKIYSTTIHSCAIFTQLEHITTTFYILSQTTTFYILSQTTLNLSSTGNYTFNAHLQALCKCLSSHLDCLKLVL